MFSFHANNNREITVAFSDALKFEAILVLWTHPGDISRFLKKNSPEPPQDLPGSQGHYQTRTLKESMVSARYCATFSRKPFSNLKAR